MNDVLHPRVTVLMEPRTRQRHHSYVTVERMEGESDCDVIVKAVAEYHHRHGHLYQVLAVDLYPNN